MPNFFILKLLLKRYLLHMTSLKQYIVVFFWGNVPTYFWQNIHIDISVAHSKQFAKRYKLIYKNLDWPCIFFSFQFLLKKECKFSLIFDHLHSHESILITRTCPVWNISSTITYIGNHIGFCLLSIYLLIQFQV